MTIYNISSCKAMMPMSLSLPLGDNLSSIII